MAVRTRNDDWQGPDSEIAEAVRQISNQTVGAYTASPRLVLEHVNLERSAIEGGYGRRQLYELVQNGADEMIDSPGRIEVVLTGEALYCANEGSELSANGVGALLFAHLSAKQGVEIGRFGLGFKSVLGITTRPEIFSRSGSLRFDPERALGVLRAEVDPSIEKAPTLRLAEPLGATVEAAGDPVLAELMTWASTVIRLPRDTEDSSWLENDLREFPAEFLLFSPHVEELCLRQVDTDFERVIRADPDGEQVVLREDDHESIWRVFSVRHQPSEAARLDAGAMADRDEIPIAWAVDVKRGRRDLGQFWAFFPTLDVTTLRGVINAPWKLNEDRTKVIAGPFNKELIAAVGEIVLDHLEVLRGEDDPAALLDLMPGRGREGRGWADDTLTEYVNSGAAYRASVPDQDGELELPASLTLHPPGIERRVLDLWAESPERPRAWCHPSVETRERRARVESYMRPVGGKVADLVEWLQALVPRPDPERSAAALRVAAALRKLDPDSLPAIREAHILLDDAGELVPPIPGRIFLRAPVALEFDTAYVSSELSARTGTRADVEALGITAVNTIRLLESHVQKKRGRWLAPDWDLLWKLVRESGDLQRAAEVLREAGLGPRRLAVRNRAGRWAAMISVLLPGEIVAENTAEDAEATIDTAFHSRELRVLQVLGAVSAPTANRGTTDEPWFQEYHRETVTEYLAGIAKFGAAPNRDFLTFHPRPFPGPATVLARPLSDRSRARVSGALLRAASDLKPWRFGHRSQERYPEIERENPIVWRVRRAGALETSLGVVPVSEAVSPTLREFRDVLPVADVAEVAARALGLPSALSELDEERWRTMLLYADSSGSLPLIGRVLVEAVRHAVPAPSTVRCRVGSATDARPPESVAVTADEDLAHVFAKTGEPHLRVPRLEDAVLLAERWGLRRDTEAARTEIGFVAAGESEPLADLFPILRFRLDEAQRTLVVIPCSELRSETHTSSGLDSAPRRLVLEGDEIYRHVDLPDTELLRELSVRLGLALGAADIAAIVQNLEDRRVRDLRSRIRRAPDDIARVLEAIGADALRARIPRSLLKAAARMYGQIDDRAIAELALAVHGVEVLQRHKEELEAGGLTPPTQWAGRRKAIEFVRDLGFGTEFAGFEKATVAASVEVDGRPSLPPLHDYQSVVVEEIRALLRGEEGGRRGLLSLPTGAGKTRVTVEALVDAIAADELESPVLWIAQTEELCEQAVQTWTEIWRGLGPRRRLTVSRLWSSFEAEPVEYGEQVIVATIQKLEAGVYTKPRYEWLKGSATCIVVDEAHTSVGPSYTALLEWQGMARNAERAPLLGLTATPFRGVNVEETRRLVTRYGNRRLDRIALGGADAYPHLQQLGILSHVDHEILAGSELELTEDELETLERSPWLPARASKQLAGDVDRNRTLLESILGQPEDWPILLFAVSVEHAQIMAALLRREGASAAAITGEMDRGARRHYVRQFREGGVRVLTNYHVLTAGFDAPKVRALYVARPTYSPNSYQQMVGRGLRGPKNLGTERCLLVNVADNVLQFGRKLAFHEFDYLWDAEAI